jgi:hypothetical protein
MLGGVAKPRADSEATWGLEDVLISMEASWPRRRPLLRKGQLIDSGCYDLAAKGGFPPLIED